jgi:hypothetical protein
VVREHWALDWGASLARTLSEEVEQQFPRDVHRWPLLRGRETTVYEWTPGYRLIAFRDAPLLTIPTIAGSPTPRECPIHDPLDPTVDNIAPLQALVDKALGLRPQDCAFIVPVVDASDSIADDFASWSADQEAVWREQVSLALTRHWYFIAGFDMTGSFFIPPGYAGLAEGCRAFLNDHPEYEKNVFLMTRFDAGSEYLGQLDRELRAALRSKGLDPVRADDRTYVSDRNLWNNVCVYMVCCSKGIAILEDRGIDEFNPNVGIESTGSCAH